jgi:hypothetical protein
MGEFQNLGDFQAFILHAILFVGAIWALAFVFKWITDRPDGPAPSYSSDPPPPPPPPCPHKWSRTQSYTYYCSHCGSTGGYGMPRSGSF